MNATETPFTVTVTLGASTYTATVNDSSVKITENGAHVGDGRWDFENHRIEDCEADLGEDVYDALDAAILSVKV